MPNTVKELEETIKETFGISMDISVQRKDQDFDDFVTLSSVDDQKDRDTLKEPSAPVEKRRKVVLRCLIDYMGERQDDLISVHHVCIGLKAT